MAVVRRTLAFPTTAAPPAEAWLVAGGVLAATFLVAALYTHGELFACAAVVAVAAGIALYEPRTLGPMLALALPIEISKLWVPFLQTRAELGGGLPATSIIDAGRLVAGLAFAVWLVRPGRRRLEVLPTSPMTLPLAILFAVYALSTLYAVDIAASRTESLRLLFSLGAFALVPFFVRDRESLRWTLYAFVIAAAALAVVAVYQGVTGDFFWNEGLGRFGERRVNTTFADPNHFARYLLEAIVVALALWCFVERRVRMGLLLPAIALSLLALVLTGSRGAWIVGLVALPAAVAGMPLPRSTRLRIIGGGSAALLITVAVVAAFSPFLSKRLNTFTFGIEASGARPYLIEAGLAMFRDHPLTGVGAGGYQPAFDEDYHDFKNPKIKANVTMSHTSAVTIMAELGAIGIVAVLFLAARWAAYTRGLIHRSRPEPRTALRGVAIVVAVIFLGSQTEGRFLEDPYLWFAAGLVVAIDQMGRSRRPPALLDPPGGRGP